MPIRRHVALSALCPGAISAEIDAIPSCHNFRNSGSANDVVKPRLSISAVTEAAFATEVLAVFELLVVAGHEPVE